MVLDGSSRAALAIVRNFGKKNIDVIVGANSKHARSFFSRYCRGYFIYPEHCASLGETHEAILYNVRHFKPDVLMPIFTNTVSVILEHFHEYSQYTNVIPLPPYSLYKQFNDKADFLKLIHKFDVAIPKTFFPQHIREVEQLASELEYPVLIKPRISAGGMGIRIAYSSTDLIKDYEEVTRMNNVRMDHEPFDPEQPIIQIFIRGRGITVQAYSEQGEVKALFLAQSIRRHPAPFGPSIAYRVIKNTQIENITKDFLQKVEWNGAIILSFIIDARDNIPKLIEANPRLGGTVESAIASGIDLPYLLFQRALGEKTDRYYDCEEGMKFRWILFGEIFYLLRAEKKIRALTELFDFRNNRCEISLIDYKPHLIHLINLLKTRQEVR